MNLYVDYGYSATQGTYSVRHVYGSHFDVEKAVAVNYTNSINGWRTIGIFVLNPTNPRATDSITVERNDGSSFSDTQSLAQCRSPYGDIYLLTYSITDIGGVGSNPSAVGLDIIDVTSYQDFGQSNEAILSAVEEYFNTPDSPTMDVDIFTTGANSNKIITFRWKNIQNIPEGMYPASYLVRIGANHTLAPDPSTPITTLATVPYKNNTGEDWDGEYQISYQAALQAQPYESQAYIIERGQMGFKVVLYHHTGEDPGYQIDAEYMFAVKEDGDITNYTDPDQGGSVDVNINISPNPNGDYNEDTNTNDPENPGQALSVDNLITHSYALDNAKLVSFGQWLWSNDLTPTLYGNQVSPMENIISCKRIPFDVASQTTADIWLGNINTKIKAPIAETTHIQHVCVDADDKYIHTFTGTYLDMRNIISIYFPYCGIFNIPASACYKRATDTDPDLGIKIPRLTGKKVTVDYVFDMLYGTCCAILYLDGIMYGAYNGTCGVDIPLTQSNRASNELAMAKMGSNGVAGAISSGVSGAISGLAGGVGGAIAGGLVNAGMSLLGSGLSKQVEEDHQQIHYQTSGGFSSQLASFMPNNIRIYVEGALYTEPDSYGHEVGYPCNINLNMGDISGYTELDSSIEVKNIPCLEEEREGLRQDLMSGFFL